MSSVRRRASSREQGPAPLASSRRLPAIPMPARAVIELGIAEPLGLALADGGETRYKWQFPIVLVIDGPRFVQRLADHSANFSSPAP